MSAANLKEGSCSFFFQVLTRLENYPKIVDNVFRLEVIFNLFTILEKILIFNWKTNATLGAFLILHQDIFNRLITFGTDRNRLVLLLFPQHPSIVKHSSSEETRLTITLSPEQLQLLDSKFDSIAKLRSQFNFTSISNYLSSTAEKLRILAKVSDEKLDIELIRDFLLLHHLGNFFIQNPFISSTANLNVRDERFILRVRQSCFETFLGKLIDERLKAIFTPWEERGPE